MHIKNEIALIGLIITFFSGDCHSVSLIQNLSEFPVTKPFCLSKNVKKEVSPAVKVYLDRMFYTTTDKDGQGLIVIDPPDLLFGGKLKIIQFRFL